MPLGGGEGHRNCRSDEQHVVCEQQVHGGWTVLDYLLDHVRWDVGKDRVIADLWNDDR